jgi:hypothetical protein
VQGSIPSFKLISNKVPGIGQPRALDLHISERYSLRQESLTLKPITCGEELRVGDINSFDAAMSWRKIKEPKIKRI